MPRGKPSLGFTSIKDAEAAVRAIVGTPAKPRFKVGEEFFDPLLQRLFVEQPYWCDPPGPKCTKFKWVSHTLPYGATTDWWFMAYCDDPSWKKPNGERGWIGVSWRKAVQHYKFDIVTELKTIANTRISIITGVYREAHPMCEHEGCTSYADHVHHDVWSREEIVLTALADLTEQEFIDIKAQYDWWSEAQFMLPDEHKFIQSLLAAHALSTLRSLCRRHHNDAHGHQTHVKEDPFDQFWRRR